MADEPSIFGSKPEHVKRLFQYVFTPPAAEDHAPPATSVDTIAEKPGGRIDRYLLQSVLGEGGMGIVYLAEQEDPVKRQVALKVIKPGMDSKRVVARFKAEQQTLALMEHPHIAHVYDAGLTLSGRPYFVMEYVQGLPITDYCDQDCLTIEQRLRLFQQVCDAVQHAHQKGIIHRDIKPSNILVSVENDRAIPKIIDFGVAKAMGGQLADRTVSTVDSQLLGTPEYMSPEQADRASEDIDTCSDIYSLGVLLYVLLTGVLPFDSAAFRERGIEHIRQVIRETDPKTPSTRLSTLGEDAKKVAQSRSTEVAALAKRLHRELEWIPLKAMRKERPERYRSAAELADDIDNYLNGVPLIAGPPGTLYRLKKYVRRNRALVTGTAVVLVVIVAGAILSTILAMKARRQANLAQAVAGFLTEDLLQSIDPTKAPGQEITVRYTLDAASQKLEGKFQDEPLVEAQIRWTLGLAYRRLGELKQAEAHLKRVLQIYEQELGEEDPHTLGSISKLGLVYRNLGRYADAERLHTKGFELSRRILGEDHIMTLWSMQEAGHTAYHLGCYDRAASLWARTLRESRRLYGEEERLTSRAMGHLALAYRAQGRYDEAERLFLRTLELQRPIEGENGLHRQISMGRLARLYTIQGQYDKAEPLLIKPLEIQRRVLGERHRTTLGTKHRLGQLYTAQGRYDEATYVLDETLETRRQTLGDDHPHTLQVIKDLGLLRRAQQHYDEAESLLRQALDGRQRTLGPDHPETLESQHELAVLHIRQERYEDAEPLLLGAFHGRETKLGPEHPYTIDSLRRLVSLYEAWGKPKKAKEWQARLPRTTVSL